MRSVSFRTEGASREVLGRGSIYTLASAAPMLAGVVLLPVTTRLLSQNSYGLVAVSLIVIQFGSILMGLGMTLSITRHAILEKSGVSGARGLVISSLGTAGVISVLALLSGQWWSRILLDQPWVPVLRLAVLAAAGSAVVASVQSLFRAENRAWRFVALATAGTFFGPLAGILIMLTTEKSAQAYIAGLTFAYLSGALFGVIFVVRSGDILFSRRELAGALRVGLPTIPHQLALALATGAMVLIATHRYGLGASARLQVALFIGVVPTVITSALNNAWAPLIMRTPEHERAQTINRTALDIGWIAASGSGVVALLGPWILQLVTPPSYVRSELVPVVAAVSIVAILSVMYLASAHLIFVSGRTSGLVICTPISLACGVATATILVGPLGLLGASTGFVATYVCLAITTWILSKRVSLVHWSPTVMLLPLVLGLSAALLGGFLTANGAGAAWRVGLSFTVALFGIRMLFRAVRPTKFREFD
jgi:O-antigen/teichoic acid export membrane protein